MFAVVASILRSYYSFQTIEFLMNSAHWTSRECFVAVSAVSFPCYRALFMKSTWTRGSQGSGSWSSRQNPSQPQYELSNRGNRGKWTTGARAIRRLSSNESEERIVEKDENEHDIRVTKEYSVSRD